MEQSHKIPSHCSRVFLLMCISNAVICKLWNSNYRNWPPFVCVLQS